MGEVIVAPGSAGIAAEPGVRTAAVDPMDPAAVVALARVEAADLVVVGPEAPLGAGVADALEAAGIAVFGPVAAAARLETSKAFCHEVAAAAGVRMARARAFSGDEEQAALAFVRELAADGARAVLKADGLAAGKGVVVTDSEAEAVRLVPSFLAGLAGGPPRGPSPGAPWHLHGSAGARDRGAARPGGRPASSRSATAAGPSRCPAARDHKRLLRRRRRAEHRRDGRLLAAAGPRRRGRRARAATRSTARSSPRWPAAARRSAASCTRA